LTISASPDRWRDIGFHVADDDRARIGTVTVAFAPGRGASGIASWALSGIDPSDGDVDGLATSLSTKGPAVPDVHPNGTIEIDHVVLMSLTPLRTVAALEKRGFEVRRIRDAGNGMEQTFFKAREVVLELIGPRQPRDEDFDKPAHFYGLAFTVEDLDATAAFLGDKLGRVKDAVQRGRRIATLRKEAGAGIAVAFMSKGKAAV
jgi:hypothetical protein